MWPRAGYDDEEVFRCFAHGHWVPTPLVDREGRELPLFRWQPYTWRSS